MLGAPLPVELEDTVMAFVEERSSHGQALTRKNIAVLKKRSSAWRMGLWALEACVDEGVMLCGNRKMPASLSSSNHLRNGRVR